MAFPERFLEELIARCDIVDVVSDYVQLTKRSGSNQFGLCPFHNEKTPSFSVSHDKQIYHCFGCGKGGGVINFIMEIENLSFPDAVHFLARRAGMEVPEDDVPSETRNKRARMLELNRSAARFFFEQLSTPAGAAAVAYINRRGISKTMVRRFGLGVAPDSWNALFDAMIRRGFTKQEMLDAGLVKISRKGTGNVYDTFRNRLMFPVIDVRGSVIGFSGRILDDGEPKYLNSPDTLVFNKSRNLFAMNLVKKSKAGMILLVEGNIDVVSLHQAGFDYAVASLGTALTPEQARLISHYTDSVVIAYDSDSAGTKAAQRAIGIFEKTGVAVRVLNIPNAKDPDEYIKKYGADAFSVLLDKSENHVNYQILMIQRKYDLNSDEGKLGFLKEVTAMLARLDSAVERELYSAHVAELVGLSKEAVQNEVTKAVRRRVVSQKKQQERMVLKPTANIQPKDKSIRYENVRSAAAEEGVIRLLVLDPGLIQDVDGLQPEDFTSPFLRKLYKQLIRSCIEQRPVSAALLSATLTPAEAAQFTIIMQKPEKLSNGVAAMGDYINKIKTEQLKKNAEKDILAISERYKGQKGLEDKLDG